MAFAYVKSGPSAGSKRKVLVSKIKYRFNDQLTYDNNKKYMVEDCRDKKYYRAQIIFIEESKAAIDEAIENRKVRVKPVALLQHGMESASDQSDVETIRNKLVKSKSIMAMKNNKVNDENLKDKIKKYNTICVIKQEKIDQVHAASRQQQQSQTNENTKKQKECSVIQEREKGNIFNNASTKNATTAEIEPSKIPSTKPASLAFSSSSTSTASLSAQHEKTDTIINIRNEPDTSEALYTHENDQAETNNFKHSSTSETFSTQHKQTKMINNSKMLNSPTVDASTSGAESAEHFKSKEPKSIRSKSIKILKNVKVYSEQQCNEEYEIVEKQLKDINNTVQKYKKLKKDNAKLEQKHTALKKKFEETTEKLNEYTELNKKFQKQLFEKKDETKVVNEQLDDGSTVTIDHRRNFVPIGRIRASDDTVHIGRNRWIASSVFSNLMLRSRTPSQFVGNVLMAMFGEHTLLKSTVSGKSSNKSKAKNSEKPEKLNEVLLGICQELYNYWLRHEYGKLVEEFDIFTEVGSFYEYASKKIAYLKRSAELKNVPVRKCKAHADDDSTEEDDPQNNKRQKTTVSAKVQDMNEDIAQSSNDNECEEPDGNPDAILLVNSESVDAEVTVHRENDDDDYSSVHNTGNNEQRL